MTSLEKSDSQLVSLARGGDAGAFDELIQRYRTRVYRLALRFNRDQDEAQEVLQEVFLTVYRKLDQFEGKSSFSTWLYRVAVNTALMRLRASDRAELVSLDEFNDDLALEAEEEKPGVYDRLITEQSLAEIEKAIEPLPYDFKTVVILRDIEGFSNEETAEIMNLSVAAVKSRLHRARSFLRSRLKKLYQETIET